MDRITKRILNHLLDKYERSKSFHEKNIVKQSFYIEPAKMFLKYADDAEYDFFIELNECAEKLYKKGFVEIHRGKNSVIQKIILNLEKTDRIYSYLNRTPKKKENEWLNCVWNEMLLEEKQSIEPEAESYYRMLRCYVTEQKKRIEENKMVAYFESNREEYIDLLRAIKQVVRNRQEIYIRDFSILVFSESKRMEDLKGKIQSFLFEYGDFEDKEYVLEECGIVHTPTYIAMKGNAILKIGTQEMNLSMLKGDIALSTESIKELSSIRVQGNRVVTIENMTSFHDFCNDNDFVIYLGGFHNKIKREFLQFIYSENPDKKYYHFGDMDAGGFYIFEHLCERTGINFQLLNMNLSTLNQYKGHWRELTKNDRRRINKLIEKLESREAEGVKFEDYREVLQFMLEHNCKLEQEVLISD